MRTFSYGVLPALLVLMLAACGDDDAEGPGAADGGTADAGSETPTDGPGWWQAMQEGTVDPAAAMLAVSREEGWPLQTDSGYVFVRMDPETRPARLVGDFNAWTPQDMTFDPADFWWAVVPVADPAGARYRFESAGGAESADRWSRWHFYDREGDWSLVRPPESGPYAEHWYGVEGEGLLPRTVRVWIPAETPDRHLYAHDGQKLFDVKVSSLGAWRLHEATGPRTLIVGLDSTRDRTDEYTHVEDAYLGVLDGGNGDAYAAFVLDVVRPFIETRYGETSIHGVIGSSLGGLIALYQAYRDPESWDYAASLSGAVGWGDLGPGHPGSLVRMWSQKFPPELYLDTGGGPGEVGCADTDEDGVMDDGTGADSYCENVQLHARLLELGYVDDVDVHYHWAENAPHNEAAWAARVDLPVGFFEAVSPR